jgi:hypothetical protein
LNGAFLIPYRVYVAISLDGKDSSPRRTDVQGCKWNIFISEIPVWVNFGGPWNAKCWYHLWSFGIFYSRLEYFMNFRYIFPVLVCFTMKNLATLKTFPKDGSSMES